MHVVVTNPNPSTHCGCCGRALTDHVSVKLGIGPVCRANAFVKSQPSMFSIRADYSVETFDDVVAIVDLDLGNRSVTNDAEAVVAELVAQGVITSETKFVVYRDSQGTWDEMVVRQGRFSGFLSLGYADRDTSIAKARHKRSEHANQAIGSADETWDAPFDLPA